MTTYNTGNPIGSKDPRDLYDNAENFDSAMNSEADAFLDRFGRTRMTWRGAEREAHLSLEEAKNSANYAVAAANTIGVIRFYETKSEAISDLPNIPDDAIIEVLNDESADGARTRYKATEGTLVFALNMDAYRHEWMRDAGESFAKDDYGMPLRYAANLALNERRLSNETRYIAHRGASMHAPENTLPAYRLAAKMGFWGAECDALLTSDGVWVLMHDETLDRTTDGTGPVANVSLATIKTLDAGSWFNSYYEGTRVPTLEEFLNCCLFYGLHPVIEIKIVASTEKLTELVDLCLEYFPKYNFSIISYSSDVLLRLRSINKRINLNAIAGPLSQEFVDLFIQNHIGFNLNYFSGQITQQMLDVGLPVGAWTFNTAAAGSYINAARKKGFTVITTEHTKGGF